jgi:hypothetical protein
MTRKFFLSRLLCSDIVPSCRGKTQNGCTYLDFVDYGPEEEFNGDNGALVYLEWMSRTEMAFGLSDCAIAQRVKYITRGLAAELYYGERTHTVYG